MNNRILQVFLYEFRRNVRRKGFLFATFGIPILGFVVMFGFQGVSQLALSNATQSAPEVLSGGLTRVGYVDETGILHQPEGAVGRVIVQYADEASVQTALEADEIDTYYLIPVDFFETGEVIQVLQDMSVTAMGTQSIRRLMRENIGDDVPDDLLPRLQNPVDLTITNRSQSTGADAESMLEADMFMVYVFSMIFLLAIFMTNGYLMQSIIEEKETRLIEILISSLKPMQLLTGKVLALGLLGLIQIGVWVVWMLVSLQLVGNLSALAGTVLGQIEFPYEQLPVMFAYLILGYLFFAGGYSMIGAIIGSMRDAQQVIAILVIPALIPFYFFTVITATPDSPLSMILSMIPFTSPLAMMMRLSVSAVPLEQVLLSLSILGLSVIFMIWLTARVFRFQILLAGQPPKLRDLPRLIMG